MATLGLDPSSNLDPLVLKLHDIENALSRLVALIFWIGNFFFVFQMTCRVDLDIDSGGHVKPDTLTMTHSDNVGTPFDNTNDGSVYVARTPPILVSDTATVCQDGLLVQLNVRLLVMIGPLTDQKL
jgi:hypothetical protein